MYVIKNAFTNIMRAKGRSILALILVLTIAISACVALSIMNSAQSAKDQAYDSMSITATIGVDRTNLMSGGFDMNSMDEGDMSEVMALMQSTVPKEDLIAYGEASSVDYSYYTSTISANAVDITPYEMSQQSMMGGGFSRGGSAGAGGMMSGGDFTIVGSDSHDAMTGFIDGTLVVSEGEVFSVEDDTNSALISAELAYQNELTVGDSFTVTNPNNEADVITLTIGGIFECASTDSYSNNIYISYPSFLGIIENSESVAVDIANEFTGETMSSAYNENINMTYVFSDPENFEAFSPEVEAMGLDTSVFSITSMDIADFEQSMVPLDNLTSFTLAFFLVVLVIGAVILIVFQLFTISQRKYEIGVLAAIGMHKTKVGAQFLIESIILTFVAVLIGILIGSIISQPIGDVLLESQIASIQTESQNIAGNFGGNFEGRGPSAMGMSNDTEYVESIAVGLDLSVLAQVMGVGVILTLVAGSVGLISVMRFEPLKILSNRV